MGKRHKKKRNTRKWQQFQECGKSQLFPSRVGARNQYILETAMMVDKIAGPAEVHPLDNAS